MADLDVVADDGVRLPATVAGQGPPLILLAGGIDFRARGWDKVVALLAAQHRVIRFVRRFYRPELGDPFRWTMADDARDVAALAAMLGEPAALVGHSSGGVLALECLLQDPLLYASAVVFEAPIVLEGPLGGSALARARERLDHGHPAGAMAVFFGDVVGMPAWSAWLGAAGVALVGEYRARIPGQLADLAAIDALGDRRAAYRAISHPVLGISGTKSPPHLAERMRALLDSLPNAQSWSAAGGHGAQNQAPQQFSKRLLTFLSSPRSEAPPGEV